MLECRGTTPWSWAMIVSQKNGFVSASRIAAVWTVPVMKKLRQSRCVINEGSVGGVGRCLGINFARWGHFRAGASARNARTEGFV